MMKQIKARRLGLLLGAAAFSTLLSVSAFAGKSDPTSMNARIELLNSQANDLSQNIFQLQQGLNNNLAEQAPVPRIRIGQSSRQVGEINVRLDQLENQMRVLNGQVEGLQFQLTQMQTLLERMQEDYEFRFQDLEGGSSGKTSAAPRPGSVTPSERLPQEQNQTQNETLQSTVNTLGTITLEEGGQPLDLSFGSGGVISDADADAQYEAGYEAIVRGDYQFARDQFSQFVALYPTHRQTSDAYHWLGESLMQQGEFEEAAEVFLNGFENYPNSTRAPDMAMKLGIVLSRSGERETACRTFIEVLRKFPDQPASFKTRVKKEQRQAQC
ncbi:tol-pal system protein YbgF [Maritalea sp.]|uniref:tol-pal system protein YbgF n=1 Tax=Maritalea sp. TaxID=2003361 RepID=UPI003EF0ED5B